MKISKSKLKQIIMEALSETSYGNYGSPDKEEVREWYDMIERDMLALRETISNADEAMGILQDYRELPQLLKSLDEALNVLNHSPQELGEREEKNNPWAICTASVGRKDKEKYESCVKKVKGEEK